MAKRTYSTAPTTGAQLAWRHEKSRPQAGPSTQLQFGGGLADYLVVTNTGRAEATTLTLVVLPVGRASVTLREPPEPLDLPAGCRSSWRLVRLRNTSARGGALSVAAYWLEGETERTGQ